MSGVRAQLTSLAAAVRLQFVALVVLVTLVALALIATPQPIGAQAAPAAASSGRFTVAGTLPGPAELVRASGTTAYVVAGKTLTIYDVANPAAPAKRGSFEFPEKVWGFRVYGSRLFVANGFNGLQVLDVSNPDRPVIHGAVKTQGQSKAVSVSGGRAVVANHMTGVDLIDVADPAKPAYIGSAFLDGYARDAAIAGDVAYAVDNPTGFYVLEVGDVKSKAFEPASGLQDAHAPQVIELSEPVANGTRVAVLAGGEPFDPKRAPRPPGTRPRGTLQVWDLSAPSAPKLAGLYRPPGIPRHVTLQGTLAWVADSEDGVHVVDLSTPAKPVAVASHRTDAPARYVAVSGSTVFVVTGGPPGAANQPPSSVTILTFSR